MAIKDTSAMIGGMLPELQSGIWVFCTSQNASIIGAAAPDALALIQEPEGTTLILPKETAAKHGFDTSLGLRQIILKVFSDLEGVGLTAAVASALTREGIPCNVVAAYHHDHVFVPDAQARPAVAALIALQQAHQDPGT